MKIAILSYADVAGHYAANLMGRGHQITISGGGSITPHALSCTWIATPVYCSVTTNIC